MDSNAMTCTIQQLEFENPFSGSHPFYCLVEVGGNKEDSEYDDRLTRFLNQAKSHIIDGVVAKDEH
jgi:hypothetical protein